MTIWEGEVKELERLFKSFKGQLPGVMKELEPLIKTEDANVVMLYSRRCLEVIVTDLCECELHRSRKTEPLKGIIDKLNSEEKVPSHIISSMLSLNSMSTYGTHPKDFDPEQVKPVLNNLAIIIKWYVKYKDIRITGDSAYGESKPKSVDHDHHLNYQRIRKKRSVLKLAGVLSGLIIIAFIVIYFVGGRYKNSKSGQEELEKTMAVLPFDYMSENKEFSWFGDAMTDEIIQQLYKIKEFTVRPRPSVMKYKGITKSAHIIGEELKVNYLIVGTVQRTDDQVRIGVQLINAESNNQLWAEPFEGKMKDISSIQIGIAKQIAEKLKTVLSPDEIIQIDKKSTENAAALDFYLLGNNYYQRGYRKQNIELAAKMYRSAIELDPDFALAYVRLSLCYSALHWFDSDQSMDRLGKSKEAIDKVFKIDPDLPQAHLALGFYYYWGFLNYTKAIEEVTIAQQLLLNNSECYYAKANIYRRAGEWSLARENFLKSIELDPTSSLTLFNTAETFSLMCDYKEAEKYYSKAILLNPTLIEAVWQKSFMYLKWKGNTQQARETLKEAFQFKECSSDTILNEFDVLLDIYDGNYQKALSNLSSKNYNFIKYHLYFSTRSLLYAKIYDLLNMPEKAREYYDSARITIESRILNNPSDARLYSALGIAYAGLGLKDKAIEYGLKASVDLMPLDKEAYRGASRAEDLARIYVKVGEYDKALEQIDLLLQVPSRLSDKLLLLDPDWKPLWDLEEFKKILSNASSSFSGHH